MPKSLHRAESRADRSSSVVFASHPVEVTLRELVLRNLCGISAAPGLSVAGRATVWYSGAWSSSEVRGQLNEISGKRARNVIFDYRYERADLNTRDTF